jgi:predicted transcriptional regulator
VHFQNPLARSDRAAGEAVLPPLGPLERKTLEAVWRLREASVKHVLTALGSDNIAYTTVMTTLDRLYKKGFLDRTKVDRAYVYSARMTRDELQLGFAETVISGLIDVATGRTEPVLACIVDAVSEKDRDLLDDLERLVREKKAELDRK